MEDKFFHDIRREYYSDKIAESLPQDPFELFSLWQQESEQLEALDPTAFVLSTVDGKGAPDSRIVLLKEVKNNQFIFYTNYLSAKGHQIALNNSVAMNFYWPELSRQIRIKGTAEKISSKEAQCYFNSRPYDSQVTAIISKQSQKINYKAFEREIEQKREDWKSQTLLCPEHWGGYAVAPVSFEFWSGQAGRAHRRDFYCVTNTGWLSDTLAP